jgi:hypothetical protein
MSKTAACLLIVTSIAGGLLAGCREQAVEVPLDPGVCFIIQQTPDHKLKFNKIGENVKNLEYCAAALEKSRLAFLGLGGGNTEVDGAYGGHFLFLPSGPAIYTAETFTGPRYVALVRYGNKLVLPGAVPQ